MIRVIFPGFDNRASMVNAIQQNGIMQYCEHSLVNEYPKVLFGEVVRIKYETPIQFIVVKSFPFGPHDQ